MRTNKQIEASRRNGAQSSGPVTSEGKARSASNATRHGLSSKVVVLSNESPDEFTRVLQSYTAHWNPVGQPEIDLVQDIVAARWRLNRILALETATLDIEMDRQRDELERLYSKIDEPIRCAMAFSALADSGRTLAILSNHETRLRRTLDRATAELRRLQTERRDKEDQTRDQQITTNEPTDVELSSVQPPVDLTPKPALKLVPQPKLHHPGLSEHSADTCRTSPGCPARERR